MGEEVLDIAEEGQDRQPVFRDVVGRAGHSVQDAPNHLDVEGSEQSLAAGVHACIFDEEADPVGVEGEGYELASEADDPVAVVVDLQQVGEGDLQEAELGGHGLQVGMAEADDKVGHFETGSLRLPGFEHPKIEVVVLPFIRVVLPDLPQKLPVGLAIGEEPLDAAHLLLQFQF